MDARLGRTHDTMADHVLGFLRTIVGLALIAHASVVADHGLRGSHFSIEPHSSAILYCQIVLELAIGVALAADILFRLVCTLVALFLLLVMLVIIVAEKMGVSEKVRRYPVALFLVCLSGLFTGIGEVALFKYLREISATDRSAAESGLST